jgi:hypothetical protein
VASVGVPPGISRHTPEGIACRDMAMKEGVRRRDAPWEDYRERK